MLSRRLNEIGWDLSGVGLGWIGFFCSASVGGVVRSSKEFAVVMRWGDAFEQAANSPNGARWGEPSTWTDERKPSRSGFGSAAQTAENDGAECVKPMSLSVVVGGGKRVDQGGLWSEEDGGPPLVTAKGSQVLCSEFSVLLYDSVPYVGWHAPALFVVFAVVVVVWCLVGLAIEVE